MFYINRFEYKVQPVKNKGLSKEQLVENATVEKDSKISELKSTLDILQMKLKNSEDENQKLQEKIHYYQEKLNNYQN